MTRYYYYNIDLNRLEYKINIIVNLRTFSTQIKARDFIIDHVTFS